jgi:hypothetical protein
MATMKRRLVLICSTISGLLLLATTVLWVWSCWNLSDVDVFTRQRYCNLTIAQGSICARYTSADVPYWTPAMRTGGGSLKQLQYSFGRLEWQAAGFGGGAETMRSREATLWLEKLVVPCWFLVMLFSVTPTISLIEWRHRRVTRNRVERGLCPNCGYDLRVTPARCPECGQMKRSLAARWLKTMLAMVRVRILQPWASNA